MSRSGVRCATRAERREDGVTPQQWERVRALFHEAVEQPVDQRRRFVREASEDDPSVIGEVESLFRAHSDADKFLDDAALAALALPQALTTTRLPQGTRLGSFEILELLGAGGMGEVYRRATRGSIERLPSKCSPPISRVTPTRTSGSSARHAASRG